MPSIKIIFIIIGTLTWVSGSNKYIIPNNKLIPQNPKAKAKLIKGHMIVYLFLIYLQLKTLYKFYMKLYHELYPD